MFWLAASPDGMVSDYSYKNEPGLIEIKCPYSKQNSTPAELLADKTFYLENDENGKPKLKKHHHFG